MMDYVVVDATLIIDIALVTEPTIARLGYRAQRFAFCFKRLRVYRYC